MAAPPVTERHKHHWHVRAPIKEAVRAATTANITIATALNNGDSLDGVTLATGDRVLVKDQSTGSQNGIYVVGASPARDYDVSTDDPAFGYIVLVLQGTANAATLWQNTNTSAPTIGSTALTFASTGGSGAPTTADYLVGTAQAGLSAEIVVGTSPGGELGGTWASPTVDPVHSGSAHHAPDTVVLQLTNKSGGSVAAGDVVVVDTGNDTAFTTTTTGQAEISVGVAQATIANNATGSVLVQGLAALVNVPSSMTRGRFLETHTVVKQATGSASRRAGSFGQFLTGGTTPSAWLWGSTDQTASGGGSGTVTTVKDEGSNLSTAVVSLDFVGAGVTATGTTAVTVTIPGGGGGPALDRYSIDATYGDHFTASSLSGSWTRRNYTSGAESYQKGIDGTYIRIATASRALGDGYFRTAPAGDFTVAMKMIARGVSGINWGLAIVDTNGTGVSMGMYTPATPFAILMGLLTTYSTYGGTYVEPGIAGTSPNVSFWTTWPQDVQLWMYIRKSGTSYFCAISLDGEMWSAESAGLTWAGTVDRIGMIHAIGLGAAGSTNAYLDIDWFNKIA